MDYKADFTKAPPGPLTDDNKRLVWAPAELAWSDDPTGKYHSIVEDPTKGLCSETFYKAGVAGASGKQYQISLGACSEPVILEYDVMVRKGFDMSKGGGKIGPMLCWGPFAGDKAGVVCMIWWSTPGAQPDQSWQCVLQNQPDGKQYITPTANGLMRGPTIDRDKWHHWKLEFLGGPNGYATYVLDDGAVNYTVRGQFGNTALGDNVIVNISGFYGGGEGSAPNSDGYVRVANIRAYQAQAGSGNGDGGGGIDGGVDPSPPVQSDGDFIVTIDGRRYRVIGEWHIEALE